MSIDIGGDDLTAEELAYLESGGKAAGGLPPPEVQDQPELQEEAPEPNMAQEQAPDPNAAEDDDDDGDEDEIIVGPDGKLRAKNGKFVSHKALHKERERRKQTQREVEDLRIQLARGNERLAILNEAFQQNGDPRNGTYPVNGQQQPPKAQQPNPLEEPPIDPETDFFGWAKQMQRQKDFLAQQLTESTSSLQKREVMRTVTEAYHNDARRYMAKEPNFEHAYRHLVGNMHRELQLMGMQDEAQRNAYIAQEEARVVTQALQAGRSPSEMMYQLAQARGFVPQAAQQQTNQQTPPAAPSMSAPPPNTAAQQKIQQLKSGQNAAQSLSTAAGGAGDTLTISTLANMSDDEFSSVIDKMSKTQLEKLMGR